jgi:hypothetical protein
MRPLSSAEHLLLLNALEIAASRFDAEAAIVAEASEHPPAKRAALAEAFHLRAREAHRLSVFFHLNPQLLVASCQRCGDAVHTHECKDEQMRALINGAAHQ